MIFRRDSFALIKFATRGKETVGREEEDKENGIEAGFEKREKAREKKREREINDKNLS